MEPRWVGGVRHKLPIARSDGRNNVTDGIGKEPLLAFTRIGSSSLQALT